MSEHTYKKIELTGTSSESQDAAIKNALAKAGKTVKDMRWFEVVESRGSIKDETVEYFQVTLKVGFKVGD